MKFTYKSLPWLLEESDSGVRYLALRDLIDLNPEDPILKTAKDNAVKFGPIANVLDKMNPEGFWIKPGPGYGPKYKSTVWSLILLSQLGANINDDPRIKKATEYYFNNAFSEEGSLTYNQRPSGTIDCLQGNMCLALHELGVKDERLDKAFEWMARTVTGEGIASITDKKEPKRYYSYKCGPDFVCGANGKLPCAWGAIKVMLAFSKLPKTNRSPLINDAIDRGIKFLLSYNPSLAKYPTIGNIKPNRDWWKFGFPVFYITDILQNIEALTNLGYGNDPRLKDSIKLILDKQDKEGKWLLEYRYGPKTWGKFGKINQPNKWVTLRVLKVLKTLQNIN